MVDGLNVKVHSFCRIKHIQQYGAYHGSHSTIRFGLYFFTRRFKMNPFDKKILISIQKELSLLKKEENLYL